MASNGTHPTFFADEMYHFLRDEHVVVEEYGQPELAQPSAPSSHPFRPLLPTTVAAPVITTPPAPVLKLETSPPMIMPGVLPGPVDDSQYSPVSDDDWYTASLDYDADTSSPGSDDAGDTPRTPVNNMAGSFTEYYFSQPGCLNNSVAAEFYAKHTGTDHLGPEMHPAAAPTSFSRPPTLYYHNQCRNRYEYGPDLSGADHDALMPPATMHGYGALVQQDLIFDAENRRASPGPTFTNDGLYDYMDTTSGYDGSVASGDEEGSTVAEETNAKPQEGDEYLLKARARGESYRQIKKQGRYTVAESTLRGRYRALVKSKSERVRRPEWTDQDAALLHQAVAKFIDELPIKRRAAKKIPWQKVAAWVKDNGGSYGFAPAACSRKWEQMIR
ncbi:hypothetical protein B0A50_01462 [Salinomyces thailandicus]|uniref:Myb-like domain-containing protein n=1 Tax=Salinomyces thailandicus TaxID=706561 RepID=A0A4U0UCT8_9PEZI|nr:hypothetical protein B0A50_01462 [Salinomyces thailandica]